MARTDCVSIHAPTRGAHGAQRCVPVCFNPRPHAGGDRTIGQAQRERIVSIHAPTRGATGVAGRLQPYRIVSIHAPTRGATVSIHAPTRGATWLTEAGANLAVSIHAPTRGATVPDLSGIRTSRLLFQSTPPRGGRHGFTGREQTALRNRFMFQSTPPRGGRLAAHIVDCGFRCCFNPRPHAGGDHGYAAVADARFDSFNPRPHAGGDACLPDGRCSFSHLFQSTPPRGGRRHRSTVSMPGQCFNPRPHAGGDSIPHRRCFPCFNPRPHAGGDRFTVSKLAPFQSTPPRGGRPSHWMSTLA